MSFSALCNKIFKQCTEYYHTADSTDAQPQNPYLPGTIEYRLFQKNWIDAVQWHLEDIVRDPNIDPMLALAINRRIDASNQDRNDLVEMIDSYFMERYKNVKPKRNATINTESPAWAIDRLSILALKIYHMELEANRNDAPQEHIDKCKTKLDTLLEQRNDLSSAIDQLIADIEAGGKYMKMYRQMKMYNDPSLNPVLYGAK